MRADAIHAMQLQLQWKRRPHQQSPQSGLAHLQRVLELHVTAHGLDDRIDLLSRKPQLAEDLFRHFRTNALVLVKMNTAGLLIARRRHRFGDVMH